MGLIDRLRDLLTFGGSSSGSESTTGRDEAAGQGAAAVERRCAICGTPVDPDASACSLCHSTDLVPIGDDGGGRGTGTDETDTDGTGTADGGGPDVAATEARAPDATDEDAARLREIRESGEPAGGNGTDGEDREGGEARDGREDATDG